MFAGLAISGLLAAAAGGVLVGAFLLRGERAGAAGETKDRDDEGEGGECFHEDVVLLLDEMKRLRRVRFAFR
jgi:hypothetical protein